MKEYLIKDDWNGIWETTDNLEEALILYEEHKETRMESGVIAGESFVSIVEIDDSSPESEKEIKKVVAVIDNDLMKEIGTPQENGCEYAYWAKWEDFVKEIDNVN